MKRKQVTAILLSAILTVTACVPAGGLIALAAENAEEGATQTAVEDEPVMGVWHSNHWI